MRNVKYFFAVAAFALLAALQSFAEEPLTLAGARSLALANSKTLASSSLAVESALLAERSGVYAMLPSISLGASASVAVPSGSSKSIADTLSTGASVTVKQTVFDFGKNGVLLAIDRLATSSEREAARAAYYSVLDSVDSAYYNLLKDKAALAAAETTLDSAMKSLAIAETRLSVGALSRTDYLEAEATAESGKTSVSQCRRDLAIARITLASLTGVPATDIADVDFSGYDSLIRRLAEYTDESTDAFVSAVQDAVAKNNPSLAKALVAQKTATQNVALAEKDYFPTFSAGYSGGLDLSAANGASLSGSLSLSGSMSLDFWSTKNTVDGKKIALKQADLSLDESRRTVDISVQTAVLNCISQARSVVSSGKSLEYAQKYYEDKFEMYKLSAASVSDLATASTLLGSNQDSYISARYGFLSCLATLRSLVAADSDASVLALIK